MSDIKRTYGSWAGNPKGVPEDKDRCIERVLGVREWVSHQCSRKRGYGIDGLYCKQHAKIRGMIVESEQE